MILDEILEATRRRVRAMEGRTFLSPVHRPRSLSGSICRPPGKNAIIAEVKFSSPTRGRIRAPADPGGIARDLVSGGCCALSVLTEPLFFDGSGEQLARIRGTVGVPVLRKDFIIDPIQLDETRSLGADAVLLIATLLGDRLPEFVGKARGLGLETLVEVHSPEEAEFALRTGADLIGVNNRDLRTMEVDLSTTVNLGPAIRRAGKRVVSESGIRTPEEIRSLRSFCDAFLIGSSIMASPDPGKTVEGFVCA